MYVAVGKLRDKRMRLRRIQKFRASGQGKDSLRPCAVEPRDNPVANLPIQPPAKTSRRKAHAACLLDLNLYFCDVNNFDHFLDNHVLNWGISCQV